MDGEKDKKNEEEVRIRKLCTNCAYRAACRKRFSVSVVNGEVRCLDYAPDLEFVAKLKKELEAEAGGKKDGDKE